MQPPSEHVHWMFATGFLVLGLCQFGEAIVGTEVWRRRAWRAYLWPSVFFLMGVLMWPVMTFFTNSTIHMLAHGTWAEVLMIAGATELALVRGKLSSPWWRLMTALAFAVSGSDVRSRQPPAHGPLVPGATPDRAAQGLARLRPDCQGAPELDPGLLIARRRCIAAGAQREERRLRLRPAAPLASQGCVHGSLARDLERRPRDLRSLHVRRANSGATADRGVRRLRPDAHGARGALVVLPFARPVR